MSCLANLSLPLTFDHPKRCEYNMRLRKIKSYTFQAQLGRCGLLLILLHWAAEFDKIPRRIWGTFFSQKTVVLGLGLLLWVILRVHVSADQELWLHILNTLQYWAALTQTIVQGDGVLETERTLAYRYYCSQACGLNTIRRVHALYIIIYFVLFVNKCNLYCWCVVARVQEC